MERLLKNHVELTILSLLLGLGLACSESMTEESSEIHFSTEIPRLASGPDHSASPFTTFSLVGPGDEYTMRIDGCGTGYQTEFTQTVAENGAQSEVSLQMFLGDENCLARLMSFKLDGVVFTEETPAVLVPGAIPAEATNSAVFENYQPGDTAVFVGTVGGGQILTKQVVVNRQIASPVQSGDYEIHYTIKEVLGAQTTTEIGIGDLLWGALRQIPDSDQNSEYLRAVSVDFSIGDAGEQVSFTFECLLPLLVETKGNKTKYKCPHGTSNKKIDLYEINGGNGDEESKIEYAFFLDPGEGVPCLDQNGNPKAKECKKDYFGKGDPHFKDIEIIPAGSGLTNGGFRTDPIILSDLGLSSPIGEAILLLELGKDHYEFLNVLD